MRTVQFISFFVGVVSFGAVSLGASVASAAPKCCAPICTQEEPPDACNYCIPCAEQEETMSLEKVVYDEEAGICEPAQEAEADESCGDAQ